MLNYCQNVRKSRFVFNSFQDPFVLNASKSQISSLCIVIGSFSFLGCWFQVENLFYNMTARRKTLQNASDDYTKIVDLLSRFAIHHINISFSCRKVISIISQPCMFLLLWYYFHGQMFWWFTMCYLSWAMLVITYYIISMELPEQMFTQLGQLQGWMPFVQFMVHWLHAI